MRLGRQLGVVVEHASHAESTEEMFVPILVAVGCAFATAGTAKPSTLEEAMAHPDAAKWLEVASILRGTDHSELNPV